METKELIYQYGHFYDKATNGRLELKEGSNIRIETEAHNFIVISEVGRWPEILDSKKKEEKILNEDNLQKHKKIYDQGSFLYFAIRRNDTGIEVNHEFKVELLEDLYVYIKNGQDKDRLYDCACTVVANSTNTIDFFEKIKAKSLNEVYKNTYVHFFGNKGNPACNALDRFYEDQGREKTTIGRNRLETR